MEEMPSNVHLPGRAVEIEFEVEVRPSDAVRPGNLAGVRTAADGTGGERSSE